MKRKSFILSLFIAAIFISGCKKDEPPYDELSVAINEFIWDGLNYFYFWYDNVNDLRDDRFSTINEKRDFLIPYNDHELLFYDLLYTPTDRFSWIVDDYEELEKLFQGITTSMGYRYTLINITGENLTGVVKYVIEDSPAYQAGLRRGDFFTKVDGLSITESNYRNLLYDKSSYTLTMASLDNGILYETGNVSLTTEEVHENPVYISKIFDTDGKKVAYLYYSGFRSNYEEELNDAFAYFISQSAGELILDLRYNGGGSVSTTAKLGSMIYDRDTNKIFIRKVYNDKYTEYLLDGYGQSSFYWTFSENIKTEDDRTVAINSMGMDKIYVLTTGNSASASELLINCLRPYIDVIIIGTTTYGKNVGSITVKDIDNNGDINPDHKWAMQPIISQSSNVNYESEYYNGFQPDFYIAEDLINLLPLGDENEILLKTALDLIKGIQPVKETHISEGYTIYFNSEYFDPYNFEMIDDFCHSER